MQNMYAAIANSPLTSLTNAINNTVTTIYVDDLTNFPPAPGIATIGFKGTAPETIVYQGIDTENNALVNVLRGFEGNAQTWSQGIEIARVFTAYDYNSVIANINELDASKEDLSSKGIANGYASLDSNSKIPLSQLPDISKQQTYVVTDSAERDALSTLIEGDKSFETSTGDSFIWDGSQWILMVDANWENVNLDWINIINPPFTATRWPNWSEVTDKPSTFTPALHAHLWGDITNVPSTFEPSEHNHPWSQISEKPVQTTRWPSWSEVTEKPSTFTPSSHTHDDRYERTVTEDFYVDGDADTYYPVVIEAFPSDERTSQWIEIFRTYSWTAPDTWYTATHKGGLNLLIGNVLSGWGGQSYYLDITLGQTYCKMVADIIVAGPDTDSIIVWLRGGHALYRFVTTNANLTITPYIGDYVNKPGTQYETIYSPRTTKEIVFDYTNTTKKITTVHDLYAGGGYRTPKNAYKVWHAGNDGSGSGLDADLLDGNHKDWIRDWNNILNKPDTATRWPSWSEVTGKPSVFTPTSHTHDDRYFTESEINTKLASFWNTENLTISQDAPTDPAPNDIWIQI